MSIENGHSYGCETNGIRSCFSAPAAGSPVSSGRSSSSTGSVGISRSSVASGVAASASQSSQPALESAR
ncbi:MAG TPA: hypothetical protein VNO82_19955 [Solirubrobacteraceae bacterium]|nr:hypothetical protein [Solirubrobacteraceae bacterium]